MNIIEINENTMYLINKNKYNELCKKYILTKNGKPINAEISFNDFDNIKLVDPKYIEKKETDNYNEIYLIDLGLNYISYYDDKPTFITFL